MAEINSARPVPPPAAASRPVVAAVDMALKLLQPMDGLLAAGETARAEVVAIREQAQQFQLLLRLNLDSGRQATLQATSNKPLDQGSNLLVTALSDTRLLAALQTPNGAVGQPLTKIDLQQIPLGTLLQGKVESTQATAQLKSGQVVNQVVLTLLNTPLAGKQLTLETPLQLSPGSLLSAQVQGSQALSFLPLGNRLDQLEINHQLSGQSSRQGSLEGLFGLMNNLRNGASLPEGLRGAVERLFAAMPEATQLGTSKGLAQAISDSGSLLEAKLLAGQTSALATDLKANLLRLVGQLLPNLPGALPTANAAANTAALALPVLLREALGHQRQQPTGFPLPARLLSTLEGEADLETLLKLAAAAISRLQTHQLSSLAQTQTAADGTLLTTWQLEIPMRDQQQMVALQLKIQSEEQPEKSEKRRQEQGETLWRVDLAFDLDPLGPLQVQAQLLRGSLSTQFWAERSETAALVSHELAHLRERLQASGLEVGELACRQGMPVRGPRTGLDQRWVDETA